MKELLTALAERAGFGDAVAQVFGMSWHRAWEYHRAGLGDIEAQGLGALRHRAWGRYGVGF